MDNHHSVHIPTYEGDDDPRRHWFVYERMWDATNVTDDDKKIEQFVGALRKRDITRYMNFTKNQARIKDKIKEKFLAFYKAEDVSHIAS